MLYPKIPLAQGLIQLLQSYAIDQIVISPGSRNAPLTIGFNANAYFTCYSIVDERCAAFFALGIAQQTKKPVVLVCTSGSALLNYYPAIAEAFYNQIPLIILSADRPHNKIDIGDGQTIRQENVFANHSLYNANLSENWSDDSNLAINKAIQAAISEKGPVHINVPFEEPLYETTPLLSVTTSVSTTEKLERFLPIREWNDCIEIWESSAKKMILIGAEYPDSLTNEIIEFWANDTSVLVLTECTSNVYHPNFINNIDVFITPFTPTDFEWLQPNLLITLGGMVVSKRIKSFLRKYQPQNHWHVDVLRAYDTFGCLSKHIQVTPNYFFTNFYEKIETSTQSDYENKTLSIKAIRTQKHAIYLQQPVFCDLTVFNSLIHALPKNSILQISNSSPIRYAQLFTIDPSIQVFCNRGTSGIDGATSTAVGAAVASKKQTIFITGDISFFYDSNALWNNYIPNTFKIIIINNAGGGIFRILPGHQNNAIFNTYFETQHNLNASYLAKMYDLNYYSATDFNALNSVLKDFYQAEKASILEIFTPTDVNNVFLADYFKSLCD